MKFVRDIVMFYTHNNLVSVPPFSSNTRKHKSYIMIYGINVVEQTIKMRDRKGVSHINLSLEPIKRRISARSGYGLLVLNKLLNDRTVDVTHVTTTALGVYLHYDQNYHHRLGI